jgi:hypothetical protein
MALPAKKLSKHNTGKQRIYLKGIPMHPYKEKRVRSPEVTAALRRLRAEDVEEIRAQRYRDTLWANLSRSDRTICKLLFLIKQAGKEKDIRFTAGSNAAMIDDIERALTGKEEYVLKPLTRKECEMVETLKQESPELFTKEDPNATSGKETL